MQLKFGVNPVYQAWSFDTLGNCDSLYIPCNTSFFDVHTTMRLNCFQKKVTILEWVSPVTAQYVEHIGHWLEIPQWKLTCRIRYVLSEGLAYPFVFPC